MVGEGRRWSFWWQIIIIHLQSIIFSEEKVNILRENYENLKGKISDYFEGKLVGEREGGDYFEGKLLIFIWFIILRENL